MSGFAAGGIALPLTPDGRIEIYQPGAEVGASSVLFTAPHSIRLKRDGCVDHPMEEHTLQVARTFAEIVGGAACTWSQEEQQRIKGVGPDLVNRDPNYLTDDEARSMNSNPWLLAIRMSLVMFKFDPDALHCDLHGLAKWNERSDRPKHGVDLCVGYGAAKRWGCWSPAQCDEFESSVAAALGDLLRDRGFSWCFSKTPGRIVGPGLWRPTPDDPALGSSLAGDWLASEGAEESKRNSLTQQSTNPDWQCGARFRCAMQLEMSMDLRKRLAEPQGETEAEHSLTREFVCALVSIRAPVTVFVYGSLLSGLHNHLSYLGGSRLASAGLTENSFWLVGNGANFPYLLTQPLRPDGHRAFQVEGEIYEVSPSVLARLDELEGVAQQQYSRREIKVFQQSDGKTRLCWVYVLENAATIAAMRSDTRGRFQVVDCSSWRQHRDQQLLLARPGDT